MREAVMSDYKRLTIRHPHSDYIGITETKQLPDSEQSRKVLARLAELEDMIEQNVLIKLPCKVGDVLYYVKKYEPTPRIEENKVHTIEIYECRDGLTIRIWTQNGIFYADKMPNVFLTKAEAEAELAKIRGEKQ